MQIFYKESSLLEPVAGHLRRHGFGRQRHEVQFYEYSMDLYGYSRSTGVTTAVELKLSRWTRALEQALIYQLCADFVYLALPIQIATKVDQGLLTKHGVGLIGVRSERLCKTLLVARPSAVVVIGYREFYIHLMRGKRK